MLIYIVTLIILFVLIGYFKYLYLPRRNLLWHKKVYEALGYKVKCYDFELMSIGIYKHLQQSQKEYGDPQQILRTQEFTKYDIILANVFTKTQVTFINPNLLKHLFSIQNISKLPKAASQISNFKRVLGDGLLTSEGEIWKRKRKIINKVFNHQLLVANIPKISQICDEVMDQTEAKLLKSKKDTHLQMNIRDLFTIIYSKVMLRSFLGSDMKDIKADGKQICHFTIELLTDMGFQNNQPIGLIFGAWIFNVGLTAKHRDLNRRIRLLKSLISDFIKEKVQKIKKSNQSNPTDIVQAIYKYQTENNKQDIASYNYDELVQEFLTFFIAGTDTTRNLTTTLLYYVALNPRINERLKEQIKKYFKNDENINWENLKKIQYIDWLQNETTRCYGPVNTIFLRQTSEDQFISNVPLKKGDYTFYLSMPNHHDRDMFKDPLQFRPQRWQSECKNIHPFSLVGFSLGPRSCIGRSLALLQSKIAIIKFMKRYKNMKLPYQKLKFQQRFQLQPIQMQILLEKESIK